MYEIDTIHGKQKLFYAPLPGSSVSLCDLEKGCERRVRKEERKKSKECYRRRKR